MSEHNLRFQQPRKGLKKDIKDFQSNLEHQINSFKKRIIEPGEMQILPKEFFSDGDPQTDTVAVSVWGDEDKREEDLLALSRKNLYNMVCNLVLPLNSIKIFRFIHLRTFAQILQSISEACNRKNHIEVCFHLRNYLEYAASYSYALDEIILKANQLQKNIKIKHTPTSLLKEGVVKAPSEEFFNLSFELYRFIMNCNLQSNIDIDKKIIGNETLVPDKSNPFKATSITKKLKAFQDKIDRFHPTYDLLSEYIHPNRYTFSSVLISYKAQYGIFKDKKLEEGMYDIRYFFGEKNRLLIKNITIETLNRDSEISSLQRNISQKMKVVIKKLILFYEFRSIPTYSKVLCACGSKKKLFDCCASKK